jgi:hypothetical protein
VRSVRANAAARRREARHGAATTQRKPKRKGRKSGRKTRAIVVTATVKKDTQALDAEVRGRRHGLRAKIVHAWDVLTRDPSVDVHTNGHGRRI